MKKVKADLIGKRFTRLVVIGPAPNHISPDGTVRARWECLCDCGGKTITSTSCLTRNHTKSCGCWSRDNAKKMMTGNKNYEKRIKGTKDIRTTYYNRVKKGANYRNLEFNITIEQMQELLEKQNYKCALTGIDLIMNRNNSAFKVLKGKSGYNTASLDRIDSSRGYTLDNIQWIHKDVNFMKQDFSEETFINWCKLVVNYSESKKQQINQTSQRL